MEEVFSFRHPLTQCTLGLPLFNKAVSFAENHTVLNMMDDDESDQQVGVWRETVMAHFMVLTSFLHGQTNTRRNPSPQESYLVVV